MILMIFLIHRLKKKKLKKKQTLKKNLDIINCYHFGKKNWQTHHIFKSVYLLMTFPSFQTYIVFRSWIAEELSTSKLFCLLIYKIRK